MFEIDFLLKEEFIKFAKVNLFSLSKVKIGAIYIRSHIL